MMSVDKALKDVRHVCIHCQTAALREKHKEKDFHLLQGQQAHLWITRTGQRMRPDMFLKND